MQPIFHYILSNELKKTKKKPNINNIQKLHQENPMITIDRYEKHLIKDKYNHMNKKEN